MGRVAQASLAAVGLLTLAPLRAYGADCRSADATTRATTAHRHELIERRRLSVTRIVAVTSALVDIPGWGLWKDTVPVGRRKRSGPGNQPEFPATRRPRSNLPRNPNRVAVAVAFPEPCPDPAAGTSRHVRAVSATDSCMITDCGCQSS